MYTAPSDTPPGCPPELAAWLTQQLQLIERGQAENNQVINLQPQAALPPKLRSGNTFIATASLALPSGEGMYRMNAAGSLVFVG